MNQLGQHDAAIPYLRQALEIEPGRPNAYKNLVGKAGSAAQLLGKDTTDIDGYVTRKAVDGLFTLIEAEEKRIRENPVARSTELLKKVFGG